MKLKRSTFNFACLFVCFVIYPERINNLAASYSKKFFLLYKQYNFPPSDIPLNNEK